MSARIDSGIFHVSPGRHFFAHWQVRHRNRQHAGTGRGDRPSVKGARGAGRILCRRNVERGTKVAGELRSIARRVHFVQVDVAEVEDCHFMVTAAHQHFANLDIAMNAAGASDRGSIRDTTPDLWDRIMAINVRAPFVLIQGSIKMMRREGVEGSIVNIGSVSAYGSVPFLMAHTSCKDALMTLTKNAAYAVMRDRIRINLLNTGWRVPLHNRSFRRRARFVSSTQGPHTEE